MENQLLSPINDFVFKKVFGDNIPVLTDFLQAVLDLPKEDYKGIVIVDPNLRAEKEHDKLGILDIRITTPSGKSIDVEVQVRPQDSFCARILYYTARIYTDRLKSGDGYDCLTRAISIVIADFKLIHNDESHNRFRLYDKNTGAEYPDSIEINTLEIPKLRKGDTSPLNRWLEFFAARTEDELMSLALTNPAMDKAWGVIKQLSADEEARLQAEAREKLRLDMDGMYKTGHRVGREEGIAEGRAEGRNDAYMTVVFNMLQNGLTDEEILKILDLPVDQAQALIAKANEKRKRNS